MSRLFSPLAHRSRRGLSLALTVLALLTVGFGLRTRLWAYLLTDSRWPNNQTILMSSQLGSSGTLIDGSTSWDQVTQGVMSTWNANLGSGVQFALTQDSDPHLANGDRKNSVFFDSSVFGSPFGSDTLAVTVRRYANGLTTEADVVFNVAKPFNSYRGPLRSAAAGGTLVDFRRVALHEFGHVLGLAHPDDDGQSVAAVMNSRISNTDALQADDLAGVHAIYGDIAAPTPAPNAIPTVSVVGSPAQSGFAVSRTGSLASPLTVPYHNGGSAIQNGDYVAFPGSFTFNAGQTEGAIPVTLLPGANRNHKVKVFLDPGAAGNYQIGKAQSKVFLSDLP